MTLRPPTVTIRHPVCRPLASALLLSLLLLGCSKENSEVMLTSAKTYLAQNDNKAALIQLKNALQIDPNIPEARFLLGKALLESDDPRAAEVELRKAKELNYSAEQTMPMLARALLAQGSAKKLTDEMANVQLANAESKAELHTTVGRAYLAQEKSDLAAAAFKAALDAKPDYQLAIVGQAQMTATSGDLPGALSMLEGVLSKSPKLYEAWLVKGDVLQAQKQGDAATAAYRRALEAKSDYLPAHVALVTRLLDDNKLDEVSKQMEQLRKIAPKHPQTKLLEARLALQQRKFPVAKEAIDQFLGMVPDNLVGLQLAGAIEYELKSYTRAESHLLKVLSRMPDSYSARRALVMSYLHSGQYDKALTTLEPLLNKIDADSNMLALAGEVYVRAGEVDKAAAYFTKASALDPKSSRKRTALAMSHMAKGDSKLAIAELEKAVEVDNTINADLALITAHLRRQEFDLALAAIAKLEAKQPKAALANNLRGSALMGKQDIAGARKSFEVALTKEPNDFAANSNLAGLDLRDKKPAEGKKRFEAMISRDPKNFQAILALAELQAKTGSKRSEVMATINKAVTAAPDEVRPRVVLISSYLSNRDTKSAVVAAQDALAKLSDKPEILDIAGRAQSAAGDLNQALATFNKLAQLLPSSPQPYLRIAQVQLEANNKDAAQASLRRALGVKPDLLEAQHGIVMLDLEAGRTKEALAGARELQKQRPKEAVGYVLEGNVHTVAKAWSEAEQIYRLGIKQTEAPLLAIRLHDLLLKTNQAGADAFSAAWLGEHPKDSAFPLYLAEAAGRRKDFRTAAMHYRKLLTMNPGDPVLLNNLAWTAAQFDDPQALGYAEQAFKLAPDQPAMMDTLGVLLVDKGESARGLELLRKAVALAPEAPQVRLNLAKALIKAGQKDQARKELEGLTKLGDKLPAQAEVGQLLKTL
ncbi:XrtA/PEP-CTERM system TPR-repeat protein PrsT [Chitinimonas sp. BJB300]|uniref:XrtA/PEP-CTERM system TPR-repeat protein PrsT n=1 Tax=Chitinimonas sp. BJB300 TaxID=1559339 RepID=UPI000C0CA1FF|nr:XrtA/PEP-CTERM system TPR-repeat protein PrsT [Chitinimonas sp. BJB300]PHV13361.1 PEP-CTERM system TPR-repeat protein PrsT [Chitinimonas sp. BJB300]TSJ85276.1 PEP-CTERM system TPR-repeat protein PrsT [Chitinimonas sp. BJB300]